MNTLLVDHPLWWHVQMRGETELKLSDHRAGLDEFIKAFRRAALSTALRRPSPRIPLRRGDRGPAVDHERVAGDVARVVGQEKPHGVADVPAGALLLQHRRILA